MKKLPKIYHGDIKKTKNNLDMYDSLKKDDVKKEKEEKKVNLNFTSLTVKEKIKELINQNSYIFNTDVTFVYNDHTEEGKIAGVVNNHIITMDNKIIKIDDLKDIKILEK